MDVCVSHGLRLNVSFCLTWNKILRRKVTDIASCASRGTMLILELSNRHRRARSRVKPEPAVVQSKGRLVALLERGDEHLPMQRERLAFRPAKDSPCRLPTLDLCSPRRCVFSPLKISAINCTRAHHIRRPFDRPWSGRMRCSHGAAAPDHASSQLIPQLISIPSPALRALAVKLLRPPSEAVFVWGFLNLLNLSHLLAALLLIETQCLFRTFRQNWSST